MESEPYSVLEIGVISLLLKQASLASQEVDRPHFHPSSPSQYSRSSSPVSQRPLSYPPEHHKSKVVLCNYREILVY